MRKSYTFVFLIQPANSTCLLRTKKSVENTIKKLAK